MSLGGHTLIKSSEMNEFQFRPARPAEEFSFSPRLHRLFCLSLSLVTYLITVGDNTLHRCQCGQICLSEKKPNLCKKNGPKEIGRAHV